MNIIAYAIGAATLAALVAIVLARLYRKPDLRSRGDAQRRIGVTVVNVELAGDSSVPKKVLRDAVARHNTEAARISPAERARRIEAAKQAVRERGQRAEEKRIANELDVARDRLRRTGMNPNLAAPYRGSPGFKPRGTGTGTGRTPAPSPTPAPDPYFDNPILNPIHPLHSAFVPAPSYDLPSPTPSPTYDCPTPSPSYDSGSSSSCDSPSPSPSSWD